MGEVIQFIPKSERERIRLIREARAIYDSIFPPSEPETGAANHAAGGKTYRHDGASRS
jgi:hypothetical protein